jgi:pimeloyl-ACP methyl ester carboxylesterase
MAAIPSYGMTIMGPRERERQAIMTTAVLVQGGWHSASCWDLVRAELTADGIRSVAPQLPMTSTLDVDAAVAQETLDSLSDDAVVVAHSWGGSPVTLGASGAKNVRHLIYLAAFMIEAGRPSPVDMRTADHLLHRSRCTRSAPSTASS